MIVTVREIEPVFPALSIFRYKRVYAHGTFIFTEPEYAVTRVPVPSTISVHRAPGSV